MCCALRCRVVQYHCCLGGFLLLRLRRSSAVAGHCGAAKLHPDALSGGHEPGIQPHCTEGAPPKALWAVQPPLLPTARILRPAAPRGSDGTERETNCMNRIHHLHAAPIGGQCHCPQKATIASAHTLTQFATCMKGVATAHSKRPSSAHALTIGNAPLLPTGLG